MMTWLDLEVKVTAGRRGGKSMYIDAGVSKLGVEVHLIILFATAVVLLLFNTEFNLCQIIMSLLSGHSGRESPKLTLF